MTTDASSTSLFTFEKPPVEEVVCGIQFKPLARFTVSHFGQLWEKFRPNGYDTCQDTGPLLPTIEQFDADSATDLHGLSDLLPRVWFLHREGTGIVQVQRDRFLHNWKKAKPEDNYPRYKEVKRLFRERHASFVEFLTENQLGGIDPLQYEMTYVNHIVQDEGWSNLEDIGNVFPDFPWKLDEGRFLPVPPSRNLRLSFDLPDNVGRLHVTIRNGVRRNDKKDVLLFELTVRGMPPDTSTEAMWSWFDLAREWIVRGFVDLTNVETQKIVWRKK